VRTPVTVTLQQHLKGLYPHLTDAEIRRQLALHGEEEPIPSMLATEPRRSILARVLGDPDALKRLRIWKD